MKKIITIGGATQDIFIDYEVGASQLHTTIDAHTYLLLEEGKKHEVKQITYYSGGGASNSAVSFSRLGFSVSSFFKIGIDCPGDFIVKDLDSAHINLEHVIRKSTSTTPVSFIIPCCESGESIILAYRGAAATLEEEDIPFDAITKSDIAYITSLSGASSALLPLIARTAKKAGVFVATNPGISQLTAGADHLRQALADIDILVLNSCEATLLMKSLCEVDTSIAQYPSQQTKDSPQGLELIAPRPPSTQFCFDVRCYFKEILKRGPKIVVVTNGPEGVYVAQDSTIIFHPSISNHIISTVGAGDAFSSCFIACLINNMSIEDATRAGCANSASVLKHYGAKTGLLDSKSLEKKLAAVDKSLLKKFAF